MFVLHTCFTEKNKTYWRVGGISQAGVHFHGQAGNTSSDLTTYDTNMARQLHVLADGGTFVDNRNNPDPVYAVFQCPLLKLDVAADYIERDPPTSMSYVGLDYYNAWQLKNGARIGVRSGNEIKWSDGTIDQIEPCDCWKNVCLGCNRLRHYVDNKKPLHPHDNCPSCTGV